MLIEQIYTGCLAHGAYYIQSGNEAAVIDPLRETRPYLQRAARHGATIKYVFETHFHADFVSGHLDLSKVTGATIVFGPGAMPAFPAHTATDGERFQLGAVSIELLHTPGHTPESCCYLLRDEKGEPTALFTGDTLFIDDVGRPDLAQQGELTKEVLAGYLYDSLHNKIMPLPDHLVIYPAHGAGSACGKKMSVANSDTLGNQKKHNYALDPRLDKTHFIREVLSGLTTPPQYFPVNVMLNKQGYDTIDAILQRGTQALSAKAFEAAASESGALVLDTRAPETFMKGFIPNSINIGLDGQFAPWAGALIADYQQPILLITDEGREEEAVTRLARVGYDNTIGYLKGGYAAWRQSGQETDSITSVSVRELAEEIDTQPAIHLLDVRRRSEFDAQHAADADNAPLDYINESMKVVDPHRWYYVYCQAGYRSCTFISILRARGYRNLINVTGGFDAIRSSKLIHCTQYEEPRTML
jgi:glyoxylase-like metal-dependent hydrolase (beta-lactamase superfamily II)/rhodanese-related sulfurtransferase